MLFAENIKKIPVIYSDAYYVDIGDHVFPTSKYRALKERLLNDRGLEGRYEILPPCEIDPGDIMAAHTPGYLERLRSDSLTEEEKAVLEVPFSPKLYEAFVMSAAGTFTAALKSLEAGCGIHLGGGFHHAFPDHGEGFCLLNDIAVCVRALQRRDLARRALIVDCDVHQGNGTAFIFRDDADVFTFSIHQENNYPYHKPPGSLDVGLKDLTGDRDYLKELERHVPGMISSFSPGIIIYLAGADPYMDDQLGGLRVTKEGLRERDRFVLRQAMNFGVPVAVTLAGGYARKRQDTLDIHFATLEESISVFRPRKVGT